MSQLGRISGPLLKANLLREGVDLAFETDLLYLDVTNMRIGVNTSTPTHDLQVNGTTRTTYLETDALNIGNITISGNTIDSDNGVLNLSGFSGSVIVYQNKLKVDYVTLDANVISTNTTNTNLEIRPNGTGTVEIYADTNVHGNIHATGNITADGDITIGDTNTDNIVFNADIASNLVPNTTDFYNLGTPDKRWNNVYADTVNAGTITTDILVVNGVSLSTFQGNIYYVSANGLDTNAGKHPNDTFLTVKKALSVAVAGDTVFIYPGVYTEIFPLTVPVGVVVKGQSLRSVTIKPTVATVDRDAFLLNGETTVEDLTISDYRYNSVNNTGYAFRFANNFTVTTKSPYIRNITVISKGSVTSASDPYGFDSNDAGKGVLLDGSVANIASKEAACLFHAVTFFTPNQEAVSATNGTRIEWLNSFSYFADKGMYLYSGATGFANAGKTALRLSGTTGTFNVGNTISYYDTDGVTVLASGTIASKDADGKLYLTGKVTGLQTASERGGKTITANGDAKLSTAQKKWGTASLALNGTTGYAYIQSNTDFEFGTSDFTIEFWVYRNNASLTEGFLDFKTTNPQNAPNIYAMGTNLHYFVNGNTRIFGQAALSSANTWYHVAVARTGTSTRMFVNGTQVGFDWTDTTDYIAAPITIGNNYVYTAGLNGYLDDLRISKGIARYTSNFTAPTGILSNDSYTVLLSRFDGANNSTTFVDVTSLKQDIRNESNNATATAIDLVDYSDFGVEVRAIGSATVYGNYGVYGTGVGVVAYLIGHNLAYVGTGKRSDNDLTYVVQDNEITEAAGAKIYYSSVDHKGDFRIGDLFYVNQEDGTVQFTTSSFNIQSDTGVTFTSGGQTTYIDGTKFETGNLRLSGNTLESLTGPINIIGGNDQINFTNNVNIAGNLDVTGNVTIAGNIQVGNQTTDTVNFVAEVNSNIVPSQNGTYSLGTNLLQWQYLYVDEINVGSINISQNTITTSANTDLVLTATGTGIISIPTSNVEITNDLTVNGTTNLGDVNITGTVTHTGDVTQTGDTDITGHLTTTGYGQFTNIKIEGNTITNVVADNDIILEPTGTGVVKFENFEVLDNKITNTVANSITTIEQTGTGYFKLADTGGFVVPVGTEDQRPLVPVAGMTRYNTNIGRLEIYNGSQWQYVIASVANPVTSAEAEDIALTLAIILG
jgi:cytoskeletal protein CcmA (bactofilin family)